MTHGDDHRPTPRRQYVLAALIVAMSVTAALLISRIPPFFGSEGGDPVTAGLLAVGFVVCSIAAFAVRSSRSE